MPNHDPSYLPFKGRYKPLQNRIGKYSRSYAETVYGPARGLKSHPVTLYAGRPEKPCIEDGVGPLFLCLGTILAGIIIFMIA